MPFFRFAVLVVMASLTVGARTAPQAQASSIITGPTVLERWEPGAPSKWEVSGGRKSNPVLSASIDPSPSGFGQALTSRATPGTGDCQPVDAIRSFDADEVQAFGAYLETFVTFRTSNEDTQPVLIRLELFDKADKSLGVRDYYGGGLIPSALRNRGTATELPIAAGVVRLPLEDVVHRPVTFSRMELSFVHQGCSGQSEILVGTIVFCPNARGCGLTVEEGPANGEAEFERLLGTFNGSPFGAYLASTVPALRIAPAQVSPGPPGAPLLMPIAWIPKPPPPACGDSIEEYIQDVRRVRTVIGQRPDVKEKMTGLATSMLGALKLPAGSSSAAAREITERVLDNYEMAAALGEHVRDEEFGHASAALTKLVLKNMLSQLDGPAHFGKLSKTGHTWLQTY